MREKDARLKSFENHLRDKTLPERKQDLHPPEQAEALQRRAKGKSSVEDWGKELMAYQSQ